MGGDLQREQKPCDSAAWGCTAQALARAAAGLPEGSAQGPPHAELEELLICSASALLAAASDGSGAPQRLVRELHALVSRAPPCLPLLRLLLAAVDMPAVCLVRLRPEASPKHAP